MPCVKLKSLKSDIEKNAKNNNLEAWFYPEYKGIKGFLGTQDIFLVGLNPSTGTFPSKKDERLYKLLKEKELANIHITDFIKVRAKNSEIPNRLEDKYLIKKQVEFLRQEIEILKPKIIIPMGSKCEELIKVYVKPTCRIISIWHYGYRFKSQDVVFDNISKSLDNIKEIYKGYK
jgi:uracil-DNA glycosylase